MQTEELILNLLGNCESLNVFEQGSDITIAMI